ncbi:MAG: ABC transporter substrate-binding protein [Burkholderiales bacterium]|nr:ABC transporter substrate-binding protein [Burkholderiales bacterium]
MSAAGPRDRLALNTLLGSYAGTRALRAGEIDSPLLDLRIADFKVSNRAFPRVVNTREFAVAELALVTFFQARAHGRPLVLMPAVIGAGRHQHQCLVYNAERGRVTVSDLDGKRVAIRAHSQTTVTWVRGILAADYGVDLDRVHWVTMEGAHLDAFQDPPGIERADGRKPLADLLLDGDVDAAIIGSGMPDDPRLQPVIEHPLEAARAWSERHGAVSINHMVALDAELAARRPDVVLELWRLLVESKRRAAAAPDARPGPDLTPFGVEANRRSLALLLDYAGRQGLLPRPLSVDDLFDDTTRALVA